MRIGFITLKQHTRMAGTEQVLTSIVSELEKKDIWTKGYFIHKPENQNFLKFFSNSYSTYMPKILKNKHILRPRILYKMVHRSGVERLFQQIESDNLDILFVLKIEEEFLKNHPLFLKLKHNKPNLKLVSWQHCNLDNIMSKVADFKDKLSVFDAHFAISDGLASQLTDDLQQENVVTIYNPVNKAGSVAKRVTNKFVYVGRLDSDKRVLELLESLSKLPNKNWTLDVVGASSDPGKQHLFIDQVKKYGLEDHVTSHGWKADPWSNIKEAGVFLLNSSTEGFALVLVEAMMRGIPCISTDCRVGPAGIIQEGFNGWLVDVHDDQKLLGLLEGILAGEISLPPTEQVRNSVEKFETENVINNFIQQMYNVVESDKGIDC